MCERGAQTRMSPSLATSSELNHTLVMFCSSQCEMLSLCFMRLKHLCDVFSVSFCSDVRISSESVSLTMSSMQQTT